MELSPLLSSPLVFHWPTVPQVDSASPVRCVAVASAGRMASCGGVSDVGRRRSQGGPNDGAARRWIGEETDVIILVELAGFEAALVVQRLRQILGVAGRP